MTFGSPGGGPGVPGGGPGASRGGPRGPVASREASGTTSGAHVVAASFSLDFLTSPGLNSGANVGHFWTSEVQKLRFEGSKYGFSFEFVKIENLIPQS